MSLRPLSSTSSWFFIILMRACSAIDLLNLHYRSFLRLRLLTCPPTQTLLRTASSAFWTSAADDSFKLYPISWLPLMVLIVDISKRQCASSTSQSPTSGRSFILAKDQLSRMTASSCRTVTGMGFPLFLSLICSSALWRSLTQVFWSFQAARGDSRGWTFVLAYLMYFLSRSKGMALYTFLRALPWWMSRMCEAMRQLLSEVLTSRTTNMQSKRERMVLLSQICSSMFLKSSKRPNMGFEAARMEVRELRRVVMPALATLMVCCSMAQWMATRSAGFILSNQSMQTMPPSASTSAPPSIWNSPVDASLVMVAVSPAADEPLPEVQTAMAAACSTNLRNCDLAVDGSPISRMLMSPRSMVWSGRCLRAPPNSMHAMAFFIYSLPQMPGATDLEILSTSSGSLLIILNCYYSYQLQLMSVLSFIFQNPVTQMQPLDSCSPLTSFTSITPVTLTLSPGTHIETFLLSATKEQVRATSPVGTQSGNSCMRRVWVSITSLVGTATNESLGHFWVTPCIPSQQVGTKGHWPGCRSMDLVLPQIRHWILSLEALMQGLVVLMMMPLMANSLETRLLLIYLILRGSPSLLSTTCQSWFCESGNSYYRYLMQFLTAVSMRLSISSGKMARRSQRCQSKERRSESWMGRTNLRLRIWSSSRRWQTLVFQRLKLWRKALKLCSKWVLVPSSSEFGFRFWSEKKTRTPFSIISIQFQGKAQLFRQMSPLEPSDTRGYLREDGHSTGRF